MRKDRVHQFGFGGLELSSHHVALNHLGHLIAHHMGADQFAAVSIKNNLDETIGLAQGDGLAIGRKRKLAHTDRATRISRLLLGQPYMSNLRMAIGAGRNTVHIYGLRLQPGNFFYANRSEEHTSELQSLMRISYAVFCLTKKKNKP